MQLKLLGTYQAPYDVFVSGFYRFSSGAPFTRQARFTTGVDPATGEVVQLRGGGVNLNVEQRGSRRLPALHELDLRLEKAFQLGSARLAAVLDVFNVLNVDTVLAVRNRSRGSINLGDPTDFHSPREGRLALVGFHDL